MIYLPHHTRRITLRGMRKRFSAIFGAPGWLWRVLGGNASWDGIKWLWAGGGTTVIGVVFHFLEGVPRHQFIGFSLAGLGVLFMCVAFGKKWLSERTVSNPVPNEST